MSQIQFTLVVTIPEGVDEVSAEAVAKNSAAILSDIVDAEFEAVEWVKF